MRKLLILLAQPLSTITKLLEPGDTKTVVVDSLFMKQQHLVIIRREYLDHTLF